MFRKLILSAVIATATLTGLSMTPSAAEAAAPFRHGRYVVVVECGHRWENRGTYRDRYEAERAAERLRHEGFRVEIR